MAEYKDLFQSLSDSVRKIADNVTDSISEGGIVRTVYQQGINRTRSFAQLTRLSSGKRREQEELDRVFREIGHLYYDEAKDAPTGFYAPLFAQICEIQDRMDELDVQISALREAIAGPVGAAENEPDSSIRDFESVVEASGQQESDN